MKTIIPRTRQDDYESTMMDNYKSSTNVQQSKNRLKMIWQSEVNRYYLSRPHVEHCDSITKVGTERPGLD